MIYFARCAIGLSLAVCSFRAAAQIVLYDNLASDSSTLFYPTVQDNDSVQIGDEITLASGTPRVVDTFTFQYLAQNLSGNEQVQVRFYVNDGPPDSNGAMTPGTVLYTSSSLPVTQLNGRGVLTLSQLNVTVPNSFTWAVQFSGVTSAGNENAYLVYQGPPTVGSSYNDIWDNSSGSWQTYTTPGQPNSFGAQLTAVPEPAPALLATGLGLIGFACCRRFTVARRPENARSGSHDPA